MTEASAEALISPVAAKPGGKLAWLAWGGIAGLWLLLLDQLWLEWSTNADYSYGFFVPLLALYLFVLRWQSWQTPVASSSTPAPRWLCFTLALLAFCFFPVRMVQVANPEWRFVSWALATIVIGITLGLFWQRGGKSWAWHFAFPIAFVFTAVPWPTLLEGPLTQSLMRADTAFGVFLFNWAGIPAQQVGNLIQVGRETVGVSEACSGIRSLQVAWMSAWFLGEMYRFRIARRIALLGAGIAIALLCNLGRTCLLAWLSFSQGNAAMEKWHDSIGLAVLALALGSLWGLSTAMHLARAAAALPTPVIAVGASTFRPWPRRVMMVLGCWLLCVLSGTECWFRIHEKGQPTVRPWKMAWPVDAPGFREKEIPPLTRSILKYTEGGNASWMGANQSGWTVFYFRWAPGCTSAMLAQGHRPEICLPAIGCLLERTEKTEMLSVGSFSLPFRHLIFRQGGHPLHVWWCLWDDAQQGDEWNPRSSPYLNILRAVMLGRRNLGQQVIEVVQSGVEDSDTARAEMERMLPRLIVQ